MKKREFLYAIRNKKTGKIINSKSNKSGKYYQNVVFAKQRLSKLNNNNNGNTFELVTYELKEISDGLGSMIYKAI